jgi:hypothetical protein
MAALHFDTGLFESAMNNGVQRAAPWKGAMWRADAQEYFTDFRLRTAAAQIVQQRFPYGREQR